MTLESKYSIIDEGTQVKQLIRDKLNLNDEDALHFVMNKVNITKEVASNYFKEEIISCDSFKSVIEDALQCSYHEIINSIEDQIIAHLYTLGRNLLRFTWEERQRDFKALKILQKKIHAMDFQDGLIHSQIVKARYLFSLKIDGHWKEIDGALNNSKDSNLSLFCLAVCMKSRMLNETYDYAGELNLLKKYEKLIGNGENIDPKHTFEYFRILGVSLKNNGAYEESEKKILETIELFPSNYQASVSLTNLGMLMSRCRQFDKALHYYKEALKKSDFPYLSSIIYNNMATIYLKLGQWNTAKSYALNAIEQNNLTDSFYWNLGLYDTLLDTMEHADTSFDEFSSAYQWLKSFLTKAWETNLWKHLIGECIKKIVTLAIRFDKIEIIDELIAITQSIKDNCWKTNDVDLYIVDISYEMSTLHDYYKYLNCEIQGEGAQLKKLLRKKLCIDDCKVVTFIAEKISITEKTATNYLNRKVIPYETFKSLIIELFDCEYHEIVQCPKKELSEALEFISQNIEAFMDPAGVEKVNYFTRKAKELNYEYGELLGGINMELLELLSNKKESLLEIDGLINKTKRNYSDLHVLAITMKAKFLYNSGKYAEASDILYAQRKAITELDSKSDLASEYYYYLGLSFGRLDELKKAKRYAEISYNYATTPKKMVTRIISLGHILTKQKKYNQAIRCYKKIFEVTADRIAHTKAHNNISNVYIQFNEYEKAYDLISQAIAVIDETPYTTQRFYYYDTLFEIILHSGIGYNRFLNAFSIIMSDLQYTSKNAEDTKVLAICLNRIANVIIKYNDKKNAQHLLKCIMNAIDLSNNEAIEKDLKLIFADISIQFIKNSVLTNVI